MSARQPAPVGVRELGLILTPQVIEGLRERGVLLVDRSDLTTVLGSWGSAAVDQHEVDAAARLALAL